MPSRDLSFLSFCLSITGVDSELLHLYGYVVSAAISFSMRLCPVQGSKQPVFGQDLVLFIIYFGILLTK